MYTHTQRVLVLKFSPFYLFVYCPPLSSLEGLSFLLYLFTTTNYLLVEIFTTLLMFTFNVTLRRTDESLNVFAFTRFFNLLLFLYPFLFECRQ